MRCLLFLLVFTLYGEALAQCTPDRLAKIESAAIANDLEPSYITAIASSLSACRAGYRDKAGRIGVLAVRPDLLGAPNAYSSVSLFNPQVNLQVGLDVINRLLQQFGDWERTLIVYFSGHDTSDYAARAWVQYVFRKAHWSHEFWSSAHTRNAWDLDDFGPRSYRAPFHLWRPVNY